MQFVGIAAGAGRAGMRQINVAMCLHNRRRLCNFANKFHPYKSQVIMIFFFLTPQGSVVATESTHRFTPEEADKLCWLYGGATLSPLSALEGRYVGPRKEMVTPWSTNAVEIAQNMHLDGISRIEEYFPLGADTTVDPMLQRSYDGLGQDLFRVDIAPEPIRHIDDLEAYNEAEGLALSPEEIDYLHGVEKQLGRRLTDSEIFGFAQINSEHCRHKIFGGTFIVDGKEMPSSLFALIKQTTAENPHHIVSAYKDNVAFSEGPVVEQFAPADPTTASDFGVKQVESVVSLKAETHNFPTTVEPFNGASTGTGGEIRDRMGGGTGSLPLAGTAVYMTAYPRLADSQPWESVLPVRQWLYQSPSDLLIKASNGASDFGNKFGQPLIAGSVLTFEHQECGSSYAYDKVIMLAGGVGSGTKRDALKGEPRAGNKVVVVGGDNYRIGLGGGSVSSVDTGRYSSAVELNAVQRANPEMQKRAANLVRALCESDYNPVVSIHDHGSAGHLNCLSELVESCGGRIDMDRLPIGDPTLSAKEIIANESQERMGLLIDEKHIDAVEKIARRERAPLYVVGETTGDGRFCFVQKDGIKPFDLGTDQMFGHSPRTVMRDTTVERQYKDPRVDDSQAEAYLRSVLQLEAVACKDWLTNKVDRSVTGRVAQQQCVGELQLPLADCGVVALDYRGRDGVATAIGHAPQAALADARAGSRLAVAEALTNIVFAPLKEKLDSVSLSANWMWPCRSQQGEDARLYNAVEALSLFCRDLHINVPTGKDSLSLTQQYPDGSKIIGPGTVIVSASGLVSDVRRVVRPVIDTTVPSTLYHIDFSYAPLALGGSAFAQAQGTVGQQTADIAEPDYFIDAFNATQALIEKGLVRSGHDISAGGLITCLLEMCFANTQGGLKVNLNTIAADSLCHALFAENPGIVVQVAQADDEAFRAFMDDAGVGYAPIAVPTADRTIALDYKAAHLDLDIDELRALWRKPSTALDRLQTANQCADARAENYGKQPITFRLPKDFDGSFKAMGLDPRGAAAMHGAADAKPVRAAILREKGTNGEREMAYMLYQAGFEVRDVTMTDLVSGRETLDDVNFIVYCGGFSNSDVLGSAKGWAGAFLFNPRATEVLERFYMRDDTLSLGVCNGCQLMVELGLLSGRKPTAQPPFRMQHNTSHKFESAFLGVDIPQNNSVLFGNLGGARLGIWVAHGEGQFPQSDALAGLQPVLRYAYDSYPGNPNGSVDALAGLASADGRHVAIMPHLERAFYPWQNACYPASHRQDDVTPWMQAFVNARLWIEDKLN